MMLASMRSNSLGAGESVHRSAMATLEPTPSFTLAGTLKQVADVLGGSVYQIEF
jgi:hypothetical protein